MKKGHKKHSLHVGPNMTPMVDIVMCILIFFMLGSTFTQPELYLASNTPAIDKQGLGEAKGDSALPAVRNFIEIKRIGNQVVVTAFGKQYNVEAANLDSDDPAERETQVDKEAQKLRFELEDQMSQELPAKRKALSEDAQIIIAPESAVSWQAVMAVYDQVVNARFKNVAFAPVK